jgi:site-specific DNA recombinase
MTRVALYERVSTDEQAKEGASLGEQKERLELWAKLEGWEVIDHYTDDGFSGGTDDRPSLQRLMADARMQNFDLVAVTKLDRFMRNTRLLLDRVHDLEDLGIDFAAQAEAIDTRKPGIGKILLALLGAIAEWERDRIGERLRDTRRHRIEKHRWSSGRTPFGYRFNKDAKELEIYEPEAEVIRHIFNTYVNDGPGIIRLAEQLNREQMLTPRFGRRQHNLWTQSAVRHVLTHPAYKGGPNEHWQYHCPVIVDEVTWYLAQKRLSSNRHFKPALSKAEFQGLLRCGLCSHTLRIGYDHNETRKYECPGRSKKLHLDGTPRCTLPRFRAKELEISLSRQIIDTFRQPEVLLKHLKQTLKGLEQEHEQLQRRLNPLNSEMEQIKKRMEIADVKLETGRMDPLLYKTTVSGLQAKLRDIERRQREQDPSLIYEYKMSKLNLSLYQKLINEIDKANLSGEAGNQIIKAFSGSPRQIMAKYGMIAFVYPDHIELKASLPTQYIGRSNISLDYRSGRYPQSQ